VAMEVDITSKTLDNTVDKFDRVLQNFAENIKEFKEFNDNLKTILKKWMETLKRLHKRSTILQVYLKIHQNSC